jgi:hypothetical protein
MLRSTTILTRNVTFAAAKTSNSTDRPLSPNGVKLPLETTGGPDLLVRPHSSDSARHGLGMLRADYSNSPVNSIGLFLPQSSHWSGRWAKLIQTVKITG